MSSRHSTYNLEIFRTFPKSYLQSLSSEIDFTYKRYENDVTQNIYQNVQVASCTIKFIVSRYSANICLKEHKAGTLMKNNLLHTQHCAIKISVFTQLSTMTSSVRKYSTQLAKFSQNRFQMNFLINLAHVYVLSVLTPTGTDSTLSAITDTHSWYLSRLYLEQANRGKMYQRIISYS